MDLKKIEKISDYSMELMEEILSDIKKLSKYSSADRGNSLEDINNKIDLARTHGVNVDSLDKQVLDFRIILFTRDVDNKIDEIKTNHTTYASNIDNIETEYKRLNKEVDVDFLVLEELMNKLNNEITRAKIKGMINDIGESDGTSVFTIDQVVNELDLARRQGIDVDDIEEILMG